MILVGDIGGTKTVLGLYSLKAGVKDGVLEKTRFDSSSFDSLETVIEKFLHKTGARPSHASFGVAGPVSKQSAQVTNLPWSISAEKIKNRFDLRQTFLLNDLEAIALAVPHLHANDIITLNEGNVVPQGNIAIIAPGTGLGTAFLVWTGERYKACASEGGHTAFSPRNAREIELLKFLTARYNHVSFERICSGSHLPNIYDFLKEKGTLSEPDWLRHTLATAGDRTPVIVRAALEQKAEICETTLEIFVRILGTVIGNMATTLLPTGGIYLGGGIPLHILERLKQPDFLNAIADKGRFSDLCSSMPVHVINSPNVSLDGAARFGFEAISI